jgi:hypothetical protein
VKTDKSRRTRDQNCLIRHRILRGHLFGSVARPQPSLPAVSRVSQYPVVRLLPDRL